MAKKKEPIEKILRFETKFSLKGSYDSLHHIYSPIDEAAQRLTRESQKEMGKLKYPTLLYRRYLVKGNQLILEVTVSV